MPAARSPIASGLRIQTAVVQVRSPGSPPSQPNGDVADTWTSLAPPWRVAITPLVVRIPEPSMAGTSIGVALHEVTGPYRDDVSVQARLLIDGFAPLNIVDINDPQNRHRELILQCREVVR